MHSSVSDEPATAETYEFPASFGQERLWLFTQVAPDVAVYNIGFSIHRSDFLAAELVDEEIFIAALASVVRRHESMRTALVRRDGELMQVVHAEMPVDIERTDLSSLPPHQQKARLQELLAADASAPISLDRAPLWRTRMVYMAPNDWTAIIVVHHAICDARSVRNLADEIAEHCRAELHGRAPNLPELPIQYGDFAAWQRSRYSGGELDGQLDYWRKQLADLPPALDLPADRARPAAFSHAGGDLAFELPASVAQGVQQLARACATTPFVVLLAGYSAVLARLAGQSDVVVGSPVAGRNMPELEPLIGMMVNTLVLRTRVDGDLSFRDLVTQVRATVLDALDNQDIPFDKLVEILQPDRDASRSPLHQVVFNLLPSITNDQIRNGTAKVDLLVDLGEEDGIYNGRLEYSRDLFDEPTAEAFAVRFGRLLSEALADPDAPVGRLPLLDQAERASVVTSGSPASVRPAAEGLVTDAFARVVAAAPQSTAVIDAGGRRLSYADLDRRANQLAHHLAAVAPGVGMDRPVAVLLPTDANLAVGVLAVLKAGGAYLPLDVEHPADRIAYLLADAGAAAVVTCEELAGKLGTATIPVISIDRDALAITSRPDTAPERAVHPDALAYVIYTSGSTGRPKGVGVSHRNLVNYFDGVTELLGLEAGRSFAMLQPLTFDFAVTMFYGALLSGGTLHLVPRDFAADAYWVAEHVARERIDYLKITPSHLGALVAGLGDATPLMPARALMLGGEGSRWEWVRELRGARAGCAVINHYGPTETTVGAVALPGDAVPAGAGRITPIGWPLAHARAYILDAYGEPVPNGVVGELYLGGATVSRGYLGRPGQTAGAFVPDPYSGNPGARLYRTGDRARRLTDGAVEFLGRADDQVKVRGYRVELGEVTHALASHPGLADCAVVLGPGDEPQLIGYVVLARGATERSEGAPQGAPGNSVPKEAAIESAELRAYLAERLPEFMVPAAFVTLEALPLTPHGKLDRGLLPVPEADTEKGTDGPAPRNATEETIAGLFGRLLERDRIGREDGFFALGGHSLLAIQLVTRLRASFGIGFPLRAVFEAPTVAALAERVEVERRKRTKSLPPIEPAPRDLPLPASYGQHRLWFLDQLEQSEGAPRSPLYNTNIRLRLRGKLDASLLHRCLIEIATRHEVLRTRFVSVDDELVQVIQPTAEVPYAVIDDPDRAEAELAAASERGFDLAHEPPLRVTVAHLSAGEHLLLLTLHHTVNDAWSAALLVNEIGTLYTAFAAGEPSPLTPLTIQYADFAAWQRNLVEGDLRDTQLAYWRKQLAGVTRLQLPTDHPRPARRSYEGAHVPFAIPGPVADRLRALGADENASLYMALLAGFTALLSRYTGQDDIVVGTPAANRPRPELEPLLGFFLNTLAVRTDCSTDPTYRELLRRVRATTLEAFANQEVPFEALVEQLQPDRDLGGTPLVQVLFSLEDAEREQVSTGDLDIAWEPFGTPTAKFDVTLYLWRRGGGLTGAVEYRTDLFDEATMARFAEHFVSVLAAAAADPDRSAASLCTLGTADAALVHGWNATAADLGEPATLTSLVAAQIDRTPEAMALSFQDTSLSYAEFGAAVNRMARRLRRIGVRAGDVVGVCLERGADLVIAVHAVQAAGAAYLPLEPEYPAQRLAFMAADAAASAVVTTAALADGCPEGVPRLLVDVDAAAIAAEDSAPLGVGVPVDALAYVIYTSGSTGQPKGVGVSHRAIVNRLRWMQRELTLRAEDRVLHKTPFSFDVSVWELFWPLMVGAGLVVAEAGAHRDASGLAELIARHRISTVHFVPSMLDAFLDTADLAAQLPALRQVVASGEALSPALANRFAAVLPGAELHNLYGPTEAAVDVTWHRCVPGESVVPIGAPVANTRIEIVDQRGDRVPVGVPGELCIAGVQLARGYVNRAALTAERFVPDPGGEPGSRLYRTGDLARWLPTGEVEYLGRLDHQVKVRGFRIELGEIEAALTSQDGIRNAVVLVRNDRLVAYVVGEAPDLSERLRERLPEYMVPTAFVVLDELPVTSNGKLDRAALPEPDLADSHQPYEAPATPEERLVARVWADVLGADRVGVHDSYFTLGGDSIRSLKVVTRIRQGGYAVELQQLFLHQTVRSLAAALRPAGDADASRAAVEPYALLAPADVERLDELVPAGEREDAYPLTTLQAGMLYHSAYAGDSATYHDVFSLTLRGDYHADALRAALDELVARHPVLRTSLHTGELSEPVQVVHRTCVPPVIEVSPAGRAGVLSHADADLATVLRDFEAAEKLRPFDWSAAPLFRVFVHPARGEFGLTLSFHHAILDGWSVASLTTELLRRYVAQLDGISLPAQAPAATLRDFVGAERAVVASPAATEHWREALTDAPLSRLPRLPGYPSGGVEEAEVVTADLAADVVEGMRRVADAAGVPLRSVLLACHLRVLSLMTGQPEVVTGMVTHGRAESEGSEEALGLFLNTVPVRVNVDAPTWPDLVRRVFDTEVALLPHRQYPLAELQRLSGRAPLFETLFDYRDFHVYREGHDHESGVPADDRLAITGYRFFEQTNLPFAANLIRSPGHGGLTLQLKYDRGHFPASQIEAVRDAYLKAFVDVATPGAVLRANAGFFATQEIDVWNSNNTEYLFNTITEFITSQAAKTPHAPAVGFRGQWWRYADLIARINRLSRHLVARGVRPHDVVGVLMDRSAEMVVALHAVQAAGAAYLPLEPEYPDERLAFMAADAAVSAVVTTADLAGRCPGQVPMVLVDAEADAIAAEDAQPLGLDLPVDALAYVIYTSGSTGQPKGVGVSHRAIANRLWWMQDAFGLTADDRVVQKTPFSFDVSVWEFCWPLMVGAGLVVADPGGHRDSGYLGRLVASEGVTTTHFVPSMLDAFIEEPGLADQLGTLRLAFCSGEALGPDLVARFHQVLPGVELHNLYGPTEAAVDVTWHACVPGETMVPIGRPVANTRIEILDQHGERVPVAVPGELCVAGVQLARGYVNRPALTAERFVPNPFGEPGDRLYRTGDLARWLPTGEVEYLGRLDHQVKIRGFRIELGEIEAALTSQDGIRNAVVLARNDRLTAYLVGDGINVSDLAAPLRKRLPDHMVPTAYVVLDELPITSNGKLDRAALPDPDTRASATTYEAPATPVEELVAGVWADVLAVEQVGVHDNYFALGGDSIRSLRIVARLRRSGYVLDLQDLFLHQTVRELAGSITTGGNAQPEAAPSTTAFGLLGGADLALLKQRFGGDKQ